MDNATNILKNEIGSYDYIESAGGRFVPNGNKSSRQHIFGDMGYYLSGHSCYKILFKFI